MMKIRPRLLLNFTYPRPSKHPVAGRVQASCLNKMCSVATQEMPSASGQGSLASGLPGQRRCLLQDHRAPAAPTGLAQVPSPWRALSPAPQGAGQRQAPPSSHQFKVSEDMANGTSCSKNSAFSLFILKLDPFYFLVSFCSCMDCYRNCSFSVCVVNYR